MKQSRMKASSLTILSNVGAQTLTIVLSFLNRSVFIYELGEAYLGLNGLFSNVLSVLSLAELGVGSAITYYLYKPAADDDIERLKSLMNLYRKCYTAIGGIILGIGILIMPLLHLLVNLETDLPVNLYVVFFLYLLNSSASYLMFAYKISIFTAYQRMYKLAVVNAVSKVIFSALSIPLLIFTKDYYLYLICQLSMTIMNNLWTGFLADREFPYLKEKHIEKIKKKELKEIFKNVYAVFVFNIGSISITATDNILISVICGTAVVGYYSNYNLIISAVKTFYTTIMNAVLPSVGNLNAEADEEKQLRVLKKLDFLHSWILSFCSVSLMVLLQPFVELWTRTIGNTNYVLPEYISVLMGLNFWFLWYMQIVGQFKTTKGLFWHGKYVQMIVGVINLAVSVILGKWFGLGGIVLGTTVSIVFVGFIPFPYFVFRYGYNKSSIPFLLNCLKNFVVMLLCYAVIKVLSIWIANTIWSTFIYQCFLCLIVTNLIIYLVHIRSVEMIAVKELFNRFLKRVRNR